MATLETIRQDVRREHGHGCKGDKLVLELIRLRDRLMEGHRMTRAERGNDVSVLLDNSRELEKWLDRRGSPMLVDQVRYKTRGMARDREDGIPQDFDFDQMDRGVL